MFACATSLAGPALVVPSQAAADPIGSTRLISGPSGLAPLAPGVANHSTTTTEAISADGRFIVFTSESDTLFADGVSHVYVRDTNTGATELLDRASDAGGAAGAVGQFDAKNVVISDDGTRAAFTSASPLDPADQNAGDSVYVRTFGTVGAAGTDMTELVSRRDAAGTSPLADGFAPSIDADGNRIAFVSSANSLTGLADTDAERDIFVRDTTAGTTIHASRATGAAGADANGISIDPSLAGNGLVVAFSSSAANLANGDGDAAADVHLRNMSTDTTALVSRQDGAAGAKGNGESFFASASDDGNEIAFVTQATNIDDDVNGANDDTSQSSDVYVRDVAGTDSTLMSRADGVDGVASNVRASVPSIRPDGTAVVFQSPSTNLEPGATSVITRIYRRSGTTTSIDSRFPNAGALADGESRNPSTSNGSAVAFESDADNLSADDVDDFTQVFRRSSTSLLLASRPTGNAPLPSDGTGAGELAQTTTVGHRAVSPDGRYVVFGSHSNALFPGTDDDGFQQIFRHDSLTNETILVSRAPGSGAPANGNASAPVVSADGTRVAFISSASNLSPSDTYGNPQVFVRDFAAGSTLLVSRPDNSTTTVGSGTSERPSLSADGNRVAFNSSAANLGNAGNPDNPDVDPQNDVFVRDLTTNDTFLASSPDGVPAPANGESRLAAIDADGTRVAFHSSASDFGNGDSNATVDVHVRDLSTNDTFYASRPTGTGAFSSPGTSAGATINADGNKVAFEGADLGDGIGIYLRDLDTNTTTLVSRDKDGNRIPTFKSGSPSISDDGTKVAFDAESGLEAPEDTESSFDVFVRDLTTNTNVLVSRADGSAGANLTQPSDTPSISGNGRCVAFESRSPLTSLYSGNDFVQVYLRAVSGECPNIAPETTITTSPPASTTDTTPTFEFNASEAASFECRVDGGAFGACGSPFTTAELGLGAHSFEVRATDTSGNTDGTPALAQFTVVAPDPGPGPGPGPDPVDTTGPKMVFTKKAITMNSKGEIAVPLACPAQEPGPCTGTLILDTSKKFVLKSAAKKKPKIVRLGSKKFTIPAGTTRNVRIKVATRVRRFVVRRRKLNVKGTARAKDTLGNKRTSTRTMSLRAPARKRK